MAQALAMGSIADTLARRWCVSAKDGIAELGTGVVAGQSMAERPGGQEGGAQRAADAHQCLPPRGRGRQGFGQLVKPR